MNAAFDELRRRRRRESQTAPPQLSTTLVWRAQPSVVSVYQKADDHLMAAVVATRGRATLLVPSSLSHTHTTQLDG